MSKTNINATTQQRTTGRAEQTPTSGAKTKTATFIKIRRLTIKTQHRSIKGGPVKMRPTRRNCKKQQDDKNHRQGCIEACQCSEIKTATLLKPAAPPSRQRLLQQWQPQAGLQNGKIFNFPVVVSPQGTLLVFSISFLFAPLGRNRIG
jgi:hypothetical protein